MKLRQTHPLNSSAFFGCDVYHLSARRYCRLIIFAQVTPEDLRERLRILREQLREARVSRRELLDDGLRQRWVLHHDLPKVLDLRVVHERREVRRSARTGTRAGRTEPTESCPSPSRRCMLLLLLLLGELEEILGRGSWRSRGLSGCSWRGDSHRLSRRGSRGGGGSWWCGGLFEMRGNALRRWLTEHNERGPGHNRMDRRTLNRYSTARSGLLKLARRARMT